MPHQRKVIRDAIVGRLIGQTAAGARVYNARHLSLRRRELPALIVRSADETVDGESRSTAPRELTRDYDIEIVPLVLAGDDVDDVLDAIALQVERAMHADPYLDGAAGDSILVGTTPPDVDQDGDRMVGAVALTYTVTYRTLAPEPPTDLDDFVTAGVTYQVVGVTDPAQAARDEINVQEGS